MPHLGFGDVIYDQLENESFSSKVESVRYKKSYNMNKFGISQKHKMVKVYVLFLQTN